MSIYTTSIYLKDNKHKIQKKTKPTKSGEPLAGRTSMHTLRDGSCPGFHREKLLGSSLLTDGGSKFPIIHTMSRAGVTFDPYLAALI